LKRKAKRPKPEAPAQFLCDRRYRPLLDRVGPLALDHFRFDPHERCGQDWQLLVRAAIPNRSDNAVTIRDRDTMQQERIGIDNVETYLFERLPGC